MRKLTLLIAIIYLSLAWHMPVAGQEIPLPPRSAQNFIVISDFGRNGYFNQKEVAEVMGNVAYDCKVKYFVTAGDNFQIKGVQSISDPLWLSSFENIYTHQSTHFDWFPALGNHDHGGNVQAQIEYSNVSRRWQMPAPYYTVAHSLNGTSVRVVIIDTNPMLQAFSKNPDPDALAYSKKQLVWVDSVLAAAKEEWVIVVGHHPVYSSHPTRGNTKALVENLNPIMNRHHVDFFIGGHDHTFQHLKDSKSKIDYFVNTSASQVREATTNDMTVFSASSPGFSICSATKTSLSIYFINIEGKAIYSYKREKEKS